VPRSLSLFLSLSPSLSSPSIRHLRHPYGRHARSLPLAPELRSSLLSSGWGTPPSVQRYRGYPVDSTHLHPHTPGGVARERGNSRTRTRDAPVRSPS